jgi:Flp pilus assembly protein TadG
VTGRRWLGRLRGPGRDRGAFTAELAAGLPALMLLLLTSLSMVSGVAVHIRCVDAAREGALIASRGGPGVARAAEIAPADAAISQVQGKDTVMVTVSAPVPILGARLPAITVRAAAIAAREPEAIGTVP